MTAALLALVAPSLTLLSPMNLQVVQRETRDRGTVLLSGRCAGGCDRVEFRVTGNPAFGKLTDKWQAVKVESSGAFNRWSAIPAGGWYRLEARAYRGREVVASAVVEQFGVGEVFLGAGQSNSTNSGQFQIKQSSGMVSSFSGSDWRIANDPQPGCHDNSTGGSFWPAFGDTMYAKFKVPIGVAVTGHGGTSVDRWQPGGDLFPWTLQRVLQMGRGGFRAMLWHQGESDVSKTSEEYETKLTNIITSMRVAAGWDFPWFVAQVSYLNPQNPSFDSTRSAQKRMWDKGVAYPGPDTDTLVGKDRDFDGQGIHFSPQGLKKHGEMWAEKVAPYVEKAIR